MTSKKLIELQKKHVEEIQKLFEVCPISPQKKGLKEALNMQKRILKAISERTKAKPSTIPPKDYFTKKQAEKREPKKIDNGQVKNPFSSSSDNKQPEKKPQKIENPFGKVKNKGKKFDGFKPGKARTAAIKEAAKEGLDFQEISEKLWIEEAVVKKVLQLKHKKQSNIIASNNKKGLKNEFK
jgi:hypothetical protein